MTLRPENIVFKGINNPIVPMATKDSYAALVCKAVMSAGAITSANKIGVSKARRVRAACGR